MKSAGVVVWSALLAALPALGQQPAINLALGQPYRTNCSVLPGWTGLTDGDAKSDVAPHCFATTDEPKFPKIVTIDLGSVCTIERIVVHNSANGNTRAISVELSEDGTHFEPVREYIFPPHAYQPLVHTLTPRKARFVRIVCKDSWGDGLGGPAIMYLREVEVYGRPGPRWRAGELDRLWLRLKSTPPASGTAAMRVLQRYARELKREFRVLVVSDVDMDALCGEDGWLMAALRRLPAKWKLSKPLSIAYHQVQPGDKPDALTVRPEDLPDLAIFYGTGRSEQFWRQVDVAAGALAKAGCTMVVLLPPPAHRGDDQAEAARRWNEWRVQAEVCAAKWNAILLNLGAVYAAAGLRPRDIETFADPPRAAEIIQRALDKYLFF